MDFITSCYYSRMRPYRDRRDISVPGRWRWCPPNAKLIPYFHRFGSFTMDWGEEPGHPDVGEIPRKNGRSRGESSPRYTGQHWCGSQEAWEEGILYADAQPTDVDADGVPLCCPASPEPPGGIAIDGAAEQRAAGGGGGQMGGSGVAPEPFEYHADGGLEVDGVAYPASSTDYFADGGLEVDGSSPPLAPPAPPATVSDLEVNGDGTRPLSREIEALDGVEVDGDGTKPLSRVIEALGGCEVNGDGTRPLSRDIVATDGVEVDGDGSRPLATEIRAEGGGEVGGSGVAPFLITEILAAGGVEVGGSGVAPFGGAVSAGGGVEVGPGNTPAGSSVLTQCGVVQLPKRLYCRVEPTIAGVAVPPFLMDLRWDDVDSWRGRYGWLGVGKDLVLRFYCDGVDGDGWKLDVSFTGITCVVEQHLAWATHSVYPPTWRFDVPSNTLDCPDFPDGMGLLIYIQRF